MRRRCNGPRPGPRGADPPKASERQARGAPGRGPATAAGRHGEVERREWILHRSPQQGAEGRHGGRVPGEWRGARLGGPGGATIVGVPGQAGEPLHVAELTHLTGVFRRHPSRLRHRALPAPPRLRPLLRPPRRCGRSPPCRARRAPPPPPWPPYPPPGPASCRSDDRISWAESGLRDAPPRRPPLQRRAPYASRSTPRHSRCRRPPAAAGRRRGRSGG